jgi:hypothetical protein
VLTAASLASSSGFPGIHLDEIFNHFVNGFIDGERAMIPKIYYDEVETVREYEWLVTSPPPPPSPYDGGIFGIAHSLGINECT